MSESNVIGRLAKAFYRTFFRGLIVVLPIAITLAVVVWLATMLEVMLGGFVRLFVPAELYVSGLGVLVGVILIFIAGASIETWITRRLVRRAEILMERIPVVKSIYSTVRDLAAAFEKKGSKEGFRTVVMVSAGNNINLIGFVTCENVPALISETDNADQVIGVYLPMSYQIGGYTVFVPRSAVTRIDMSSEDAMRFVLTAGISNTNGAVSPASANDKAPDRSAEI